MFRIALAFCAGAAALHVLAAPWPPAAAAVPALVAPWLTRRAPALAAALAGFAAALLSAALALGSGWPCARDRELVELSGRVASPPIARAGRTDIDLDVEEASAPDFAPRRIRLSWYDPAGLPGAGERWRFGARLRCRRGFANPGAPDRELALLRERIDATGYVAGLREPARIAGPPGHPVERLRGRIAGAIADSLPPGASAAVLQGLSVGVRGAIPDELWETFAVTGVAHLIAISGLHVTGCAVAALVLLRLAWRSRALARLPARLAVEVVAVVAVTAAYAWLSGASLPALRTLVMVALFASLKLLRRALPLHLALALAALILVGADPLAVASAGFWLSFVATAALLAVAADGAGWRSLVGGFARAQLAITLLLAPVLALSFGRLSLVAPAVNAVAVPVFTLALLPAILLGTALAAIAPEASAGLWRLLAAGLDATWPPLSAIAAWPAASWAPAAQPAALVAAAGVVLFAACLLPIAGLRVVAAVLLVAVTCGRAERIEAGGFALTVLDVGQGLAAVVETKSHAFVFDAGPQWRGGSAAARVSLLPFLRARGIRRIDRLVISHDDQDHAGGAAALGRELHVARTMTAPGSGTAAGEHCRRGDGWQWDGVAFRVLHPPAGFEGDDNDRSCALRVSGPGGSALLLADPEAAAETALATEPIAADVVLVPHHGSAGSSSPALVAAAYAHVAIASAGFGNRWDMPRAEVVARWRAAGATVLDTATQGAVRVRFAASRAPLALEAERRDRPRWWRARAEY
jgi:competence protein ComEC